MNNTKTTQIGHSPLNATEPGYMTMSEFVREAITEKIERDNPELMMQMRERLLEPLKLGN